MTAWRSLTSWLAVLVLAGAAQAQTYTLEETDLTDSCFQIQLQMSLKGELKIQQEGKLEPLPQTAAADHDFIERILKEGPHGVVQKAARHYKSASATITIREDRSDRKLRPEHALLMAQRVKDRVVSFSAKGSLTREELEVTQHFDTLALPGLLPEKQVAVGDTWKIHNAAAQALCYFDGLTTHELRCKLEKVADNLATVSLSGPADGIDAGAVVKLKISGSYQFDLKQKRIVALDWQQHDERDQGPVSPVMSLDVTVKLTRTPLESAVEVNDFALVPFPQEAVPPASVTNLNHTDPKNRYELTLARQWILVAQTEQHLVLRLLDRGDFVAQATVVAWPKTEASKHMSAEDFQTAMQESPGWQQEEILEAKEIEADKGYWIYRLAASGELNGLRVLQYSYLVAGPNGDQLVLAFTLTPAQVAKLGTRDMDLVRSVLFPGSPKQDTTLLLPGQ